MSRVRNTSIIQPLRYTCASVFSCALQDIRIKREFLTLIIIIIKKMYDMSCVTYTNVGMQHSIIFAYIIHMYLLITALCTIQIGVVIIKT